MVIIMEIREVSFFEWEHFEVCLLGFFSFLCVQEDKGSVLDLLENNEWCCDKVWTSCLLKILTL